MGLLKTYKVPLPEVWTASAPDPAVDGPAARAAFLRFAKFIKANLAGQTSLRTDAAWASQLVALQGIAQVSPPDLVLREETASAELARLGGVGYGPAPCPLPGPFDLRDIYDAEVEAAVQAAYAKDYLMLGFGPWQAP